MKAVRTVMIFMLKGIVDRGAPTIATDVLRWTCRIFDYGIQSMHLEVNPCSTSEVSDAGGKEIVRDRWLTRAELIRFFQAMRVAKGFSRQNELTFKLLLALCVRKMELCAARCEEVVLNSTIWHCLKSAAKTAMLKIYHYPSQQLNGYENFIPSPVTVFGSYLREKCNTE